MPVALQIQGSIGLLSCSISEALIVAHAFTEFKTVTFAAKRVNLQTSLYVVIYILL